MTNVFIIISSSSNIISTIIIISHVTCALWKQEKPGLKKGYEGEKKQQRK